jgi:hypothetical protein
MRTLMLAVATVGLLGTAMSSAPAGEKSRGKDGDQDARDCGKSQQEILQEMLKKFDGNREALIDKIKEHFKDRHPDGRCHCRCDHERKGPPKDDGDRELKPEDKDAGERKGDDRKGGH